MKINKKILKKILAESATINKAMFNIFEISDMNYLRLRAAEILTEVQISDHDYQDALRQAITLLALSRYKNGAIEIREK